MTATVAVEVWMRPWLVLEDGVRPVALHRERDFLVSTAVARARAELLGLESPALGVAGQHAVDVTGPDGGLVAADALAHLEDDVLAVGGIRRRHRDAQLLLETC